MTDQRKVNDLAAFLVAAGPYSYYVCGGWNSAPTEWFEVYDRPLGEPVADAVLSDIIDYDQFLTGMRSEATYFMFKSFLPKIVQIPSSAIPIALLGVFGYIQPEGGKVQDQSETGVPAYIKVVVSLGFVMSLLASWIKSKTWRCSRPRL